MTAKITDYTLNAKDNVGNTFIAVRHRSVSNSTKFPNGKVDYSAQNAYSLDHLQLLHFDQYPYYPKDGGPPQAWSVSDGSEGPVGPFPTSADNQALAKFNGKLRNGSAELGVTLASWKQSREMIVSSSRKAQRALDSSIELLRNNRGALRRLRNDRDPLANQVLATEFGWMPLFNDFYASLYTVIQRAVPPMWLGATGRALQNDSFTTSSSRLTVVTQNTSRIVANVRVTNPNLWLANRLGVINPARVAWDIVPWSWVVGMFVNVNQMVSSVTDQVGLSVSDKSTTRSRYTVYDRFSFSDPAFLENPGTEPFYSGPVHSVFERWQKERVIGAHPAPTWEVRVPKLDWNLAVIATAVVVQRVKKLNDLIKIF